MGRQSAGDFNSNGGADLIGIRYAEPLPEEGGRQDLRVEGAELPQTLRGAIRARRGSTWIPCLLAIDHAYRSSKDGFPKLKSEISHQLLLAL